jgi:AcrR family transcriptional regulator
MSVKRTQAERRAATRGALIDAARRLFAAQGFARTGTPQIVEEAGVTRGALYHHFADKADLFKAVYESVEAELVEQVWAAALAQDGDTPRQTALLHLRAGAEAFVDACVDPEVHRITLIEAPGVLGWDEWKRLDADYGLGVIRTALERATAAGALRPLPLDMLAHTVLGALTETGLMVARSDDPAGARDDAVEIIHALIDGLRAPGT